jgi:hypothetical protein
MLLCWFDPEDAHRDPTKESSNEIGPDDFKKLLLMFVSVDKAEQKARTLCQWLAIAREKGLKYHSWIDTYALARNEESSADSSSGHGVPKVGASDTANETPQERRAVAAETARGVKREILEHWDGIAKTYGPDADAAQVARYLKTQRAESESPPKRKTIHNRLGELRAAKLIP